MAPESKVNGINIDQLFSTDRSPQGKAGTRQIQVPGHQ